MSSRDKILARRAKFMAAAIASAGLVGCGGDVEPTPSDASVDAADGGDTGFMPCLTADAPPPDTGPMPCLSDTGPEPCLEPPLDTGVADTGPEPCLAPPPEDAG